MNKKNKKLITITHIPTSKIIARGFEGWGFMAFEGNYYIRLKYIRTTGFQFSYIPRFCIYKFLYVWLHLKVKDYKEEFIAWMYVIPNPLLPFIWFRIGLPRNHHALKIEIENV
ncbi:hypothetical protein Cyan10605_2556 [Cyanobacterium aponinum PCC 10605]|uniref:Uncharacterized protein n=2 Tax=Cyanobacterium TaxID=102234 RepID=K9Z621_CYAAP|nr:hypothetical protein Cyan10605_2556 [Cyanobacterium aponinum PCC 10605]